MKARNYLAIVVLVTLLLGVASVGYASRYDYDFNGQTLYFMLFRNWHGITPLGYQWHGAPREGGYNWMEPDPRLQGHIESVEEMFNCKIEFLESHGEHDLVQRLTQAFLAGEQVDYIHVTEHALYTLSTQQMIHALDDVLDEAYWASLPSMFQTKEGLQVLGKTYGFEHHNYNIEGVGLWWNKDMFEREGLPSLYELHESDEWNYELFEQFALHVTKDTDGDGNLDQFGLGLAGRMECVENFILTNNGYMTTVDKNGRVVVNFHSENVVEALELLQRLQQAGAVQPDAWLMDGRLGMSIDFIHANRQDQMGDDEYGLVPLPKGPKADRYVSPIWNRWQGAIPITVENPRAVIEVVNALWQLTEPYWPVDRETYERVYWEQNVGMMVNDRQSLANYKWLMSNAEINPHRAISNQAGFRDVAERIIFGGENAATALAQIAPVAQGLLDELYGQK